MKLEAYIDEYAHTTDMPFDVFMARVHNGSFKELSLFKHVNLPKELTSQMLIAITSNDDITDESSTLYVYDADRNVYFSLTIGFFDSWSEPVPHNLEPSFNRPMLNYIKGLNLPQSQYTSMLVGLERAICNHKPSIADLRTTATGTTPNFAMLNYDRFVPNIDAVPELRSVFMRVYETQLEVAEV